MENQFRGRIVAPGTGGASGIGPQIHLGPKVPGQRAPPRTKRDHDGGPAFEDDVVDEG